MSRCKSENCQAEISWAVNDDTGRGVPLDPEPVDDGKLVATGQVREGQIVVRYVKKGEDTGVLPRYNTHFSTCPDAEAFRRERAKS